MIWDMEGLSSGDTPRWGGTRVVVCPWANSPAKHPANLSFLPPGSVSFPFSLNIFIIKIWSHLIIHEGSDQTSGTVFSPDGLDWRGANFSWFHSNQDLVSQDCLCTFTLEPSHNKTWCRLWRSGVQQCLPQGQPGLPRKHVARKEFLLIQNIFPSVHHILFALWRNCEAQKFRWHFKGMSSPGGISSSYLHGTLLIVYSSSSSLSEKI